MIFNFRSLMATSKLGTAHCMDMSALSVDQNVQVLGATILDQQPALRAHTGGPPDEEQQPVVLEHQSHFDVAYLKQAHSGQSTFGFVLGKPAFVSLPLYLAVAPIRFRQAVSICCSIKGLSRGPESRSRNLFESACQFSNFVWVVL